MKIIKSAQNPLIKETKKLHKAKGRDQQNKFIAEGIRCIEPLYKAEMQLHTLFYTEMMAHEAEKYPEHLCIMIPDAIMKEISPSATPSGLLAVFAKPQAPALDEMTAGLVCAKVSDPGNMGTLIRTCAAMGYRTVVTVESVDAWNPKVVQASAGALGMVKLFDLGWNDLVANKGNLQLASLVVRNGESITSVQGDNTLLVVGNEAHGVPFEWIDQCEQQITLDMPGETESLNAGVAGSIALYCMRNQ